MIQLVTPNPNIPCIPGWCLQYVRQAFGAPVVEPTATAGWNNAKFKHRDWNFPAGMWVPVWFELATEPAGHVALLAPNGAVYSTTSPFSNLPTIHPNMAHLIAAYAPYNPLTYLGWSEDISGVRVVQDFSVQSQAETIKPVQEDIFMALTEEQQLRILAAADRINYVIDQPKDKVLTTAHIEQVAASAAGKVLNTPVRRGGVGAGLGEVTSVGAVVAWFDSAVLGLADAVNKQAANSGATPEQVIDAVKQALATGVVKVDVSVEGAK